MLRGGAVAAAWPGWGVRALRCRVGGFGAAIARAAPPRRRALAGALPMKKGAFRVLNMFLRRITACKVLFLCYCMYQLPFEPANTCC